MCLRLRENPAADALHASDLSSTGMRMQNVSSSCQILPVSASLGLQTAVRMSRQRRAAAARRRAAGRVHRTLRRRWAGSARRRPFTPLGWPRCGSACAASRSALHADCSREQNHGTAKDADPAIGESPKPTISLALCIAPAPHASKLRAARRFPAARRSRAPPRAPAMCVGAVPEPAPLFGGAESSVDGRIHAVPSRQPGGAPR